jgi:hypothetical protein
MMTYYNLLFKSSANEQKVKYQKYNDDEVNHRKNYSIYHKNLLECNTNYTNNKHVEIWQPADLSLNKLRIVRAVLVYYPSDRTDWFEQEFRWLFRSWIEMQKYEPVLWRTDLVVFTDTKRLGKNMELFNGLKCSVSNLRTSKKDKPMCTLVDYISIKDRVSEKKLKETKNIADLCLKKLIFLMKMNRIYGNFMRN